MIYTICKFEIQIQFMLSAIIIIITIIDNKIIIMYNTDIQETKCQKNCQELGNKNKSTLKRENDYDKI